MRWTPRPSAHFWTRSPSGEIDAAEAARRLARLPYADLGFARVDHHRPLRQGMPEAVYGPGKTPEQCAAIVGELLAHGEAPVVLTRGASAEQAGGAGRPPRRPGDGHDRDVALRPTDPRPERVVIVTAGTADGPVADECAAVLQAYGFRPERLDDVGVAGLHRLLAHARRAGERPTPSSWWPAWKGALASVVGGLTGRAGGRRAHQRRLRHRPSAGVTALLAMLSSCAQGVTVVGIDNGFGAACAVTRLCNQRAGRA